MEVIATKMTKQTTVSDNEKEAITPQTILNRFKLYNDYIAKIRQQNLEAGLDVKRNNDFVSQNKLRKQEAYEEFIRKTTNAKTNSWFTLNSLQAAGVVSDLDIEQFPSREYPYTRLNRLTRVKTPNGKEWLQRMFTIYALTKEGNSIHKVISDIDYYTKPIAIYHYVPEDPLNPDGKQIHVAIIRDAGWGHEPIGQKVQLLEYSEDKVHQILKDIPAGDFSDLYSGTTLTLIKAAETQSAITVKSLSEFLEPFDIVWNRYRGKNANVKVDVAELVSELQKQTIAAGEHTQYG